MIRRYKSGIMGSAPCAISDENGELVKFSDHTDLMASKTRFIDALQIDKLDLQERVTRLNQDKGVLDETVNSLAKMGSDLEKALEAKKYELGCSNAATQYAEGLYKENIKEIDALHSELDDLRAKLMYAEMNWDFIKADFENVVKVLTLEGYTLEKIKKMARP